MVATRSSQRKVDLATSRSSLTKDVTRHAGACYARPSLRSANKVTKNKVVTKENIAKKVTCKASPGRPPVHDEHAIKAIGLKFKADNFDGYVLNDAVKHVKLLIVLPDKKKKPITYSTLRKRVKKIMGKAWSELTQADYAKLQTKAVVLGVALPTREDFKRVSNGIEHNPQLVAAAVLPLPAPTTAASLPTPTVAPAPLPVLAAITPLPPHAVVSYGDYPHQMPIIKQEIKVEEYCEDNLPCGFGFCDSGDDGESSPMEKTFNFMPSYGLDDDEDPLLPEAEPSCCYGSYMQEV